MSQAHDGQDLLRDSLDPNEVRNREDTALVRRADIDFIEDKLTKEDAELVYEAFKSGGSRERLKRLAKKNFSSILNTEEKLEYAMQEIVGLGFIERVLKKEPSATDIRYNGTQLTIKTGSVKYVYEDEEVTEHDVVRIIGRFVNSTNKEFTEKSPRMNTQFGHMRVNAVHRKNAPYGTTMAIRISKPKMAVTEENFHTLADDFILTFCKNIMKAGMVSILSGIPGSGKTELTKTLMSFLDFKEVIVTIEDTPEGHFKVLFPHLDITSWYTNTNLTESELIDETLRNDVDWVFVTETRTASSAYALFKGFLTGAKGVTSLHAKSSHEIPERYYNMIKSEIQIDKEAFYSDFFGTVNFGFHQDRRWVNNRIIRYTDSIVEFTSDGEKREIYRRWEENGIFYSEVPNTLSEKTALKMLTSGCNMVDLIDTGLLPQSIEEELKETYSMA